MRHVGTTLLSLALLGVATGHGLASDSDAPDTMPSATPSPSASPRPSDGLLAPGATASPAGSGSVLVELASPSGQAAWSTVRTGSGPAAREDHTWTVDGEGRFAFLFGGRDGDRTFGDLWRFDLETDTWTRLSPRGRAPAPRSGHSAVWVDGHGLVVFAGQRGADFYGDLWAYDSDDERWRELPAGGAPPRARYGSCMVVGPDGRPWISHGFTFAGRFDDTRAYGLRTNRWSALSPDGRRPGPRCLHDCFTSMDGALVLFGGQDDDDPALGDLWVTRADGTWRRLPDPGLRDRRLYALATSGGQAWIFGGAGRDGRPLDDLWRVDRTTLRFVRVAVDGPAPSGRSASTLVADPARDRLLLFGGRAGQARSDLWQLTSARPGTVATRVAPTPGAGEDAATPGAGEDAPTPGAGEDAPTPPVS